MCVCTCVCEPTPISPLVFLACSLPNKQPTKFQRLHPNKQQQPLGNAVPAGWGLGQAGRAAKPPPLPSSSLLGKGPAWLPGPFLQAGLVCSPQAIDGLAAAYSKSE